MIIITGPTATGKTKRAVDLAKRIGGEIVSADSRQVYRRMDIGTGKDLSEYGDVAYHLIDIAEPGEVYNLYRFLDDAHRAVNDIESRGCTAIVCGGSGMYVEALAKGTVLPSVPQNPELRESLRGKTLTELRDILSRMKQLHNTTDTDTVARAIRAIEIQSYYMEHPEEAPSDVATLNNPQPLIIGVMTDRETRRRRITERLHSRLSQGMVDEVRNLLDLGVSADRLICYGLEYKFLTLYITGQITYDELVSQLEIAIHQFAKRQMTWFRGMEKRGLHIDWLPAEMPSDEFTDRILSLCEQRRQ